MLQDRNNGLKNTLQQAHIAVKPTALKASFKRRIKGEKRKYKAHTDKSSLFFLNFAIIIKLKRSL